MRPITLDGRLPLLNSRIAVVMSPALRPTMRGITESAILVEAWQPVHELAPGGASAASAGPATAQAMASTAAVRDALRAFLELVMHKGKVTHALAGRLGDGVQHRGTCNRDGRLAYATPEAARWHQDNFLTPI